MLAFVLRFLSKVTSILGVHIVKRKKVGLFGYTGMVGGEIERVLDGHDGAEIVFRQNSTGHTGNLEEAELVFLATKDEESMRLATQMIGLGKRVIDMSGAFRLDQDDFEGWYKIKHTAPGLLEQAVYGLPALGEQHRNMIASANLVANPGCYATSLILALRPIYHHTRWQATVVATSGNSGARKTVESVSNEATYGYGRMHKHVPEVARYSLAKINFTPIVLESVFRGINANICSELSSELKLRPSEVAVAALTKEIVGSYVPEDLVFVVTDSKEKTWGTKDVNCTHKVLIKIRVDGDNAYICSMIDNLGKGAASQAVENMNLMLGFPRLHGIGNTYSCV